MPSPFSPLARHEPPLFSIPLPDHLLTPRAPHEIHLPAQGYRSLQSRARLSLFLYARATCIDLYAIYLLSQLVSRAVPQPLMARGDAECACLKDGRYVFSALEQSPGEDREVKDLRVLLGYLAVG